MRKFGALLLAIIIFFPMVSAANELSESQCKSKKWTP